MSDFSYKQGENEMYQINEYVNYGIHGICKIEEIKRMSLGSGGTEQEYYILKPVSQESATVYVPTANKKLLERMRPVLSKEEIDGIIRSVRDQKMEWIDDRKKRLAEFQEILSRRDERELLLLASCLYVKAESSEKGLSSSERELLKKVETIIEREFAFSLNLNSGSIAAYISERLA